MLIRSAMKVEVSSFVLSRFRSYFSASSMHSGSGWVLWHIISALMSKRMNCSSAARRASGASVCR